MHSNCFSPTAAVPSSPHTHGFILFYGPLHLMNEKVDAEFQPAVLPPTPVTLLASSTLSLTNLFPQQLRTLLPYSVRSNIHTLPSPSGHRVNQEET